MGVVKGAFASLKAGGGNEAWGVSDVTGATVHLIDARAATRQRVGARASMVLVVVFGFGFGSGSGSGSGFGS
eukprot:8934200-Pyramimonas_sp.AAC.1